MVFTMDVKKKKLRTTEEKTETIIENYIRLVCAQGM